MALIHAKKTDEQIAECSIKRFTDNQDVRAWLRAYETAGRIAG
jgi:hypothetical protein